MQAMQRMITDLHLDLLKYIMILMVKSSEGAANLARAISVCSMFSKVADDADVLKAVRFQDVSVHNRGGVFQQTNGLLHRCAQVGNAAAQYLLGKVILMSSSQLLAAEMKLVRTSGSQRMKLTECLHEMPRNDALVANFMAHYAPDQACSTSDSSQTLHHLELVRNFVYQCSSHDVTLLHLHLNDYVDCYTERGSKGNFVLHYLINKMCHYGHRVRTSLEVPNETLDDKREMKEALIESMEHVTAWRRSRQSNQGLVPGGNFEDFVQPPEDWHLHSNRIFTHRTYASIEELVNLDVLSEFEESRISVLACFCHAFP